MVKLNLPGGGRRDLDLLWQAGGRYCFGNPSGAVRVRVPQLTVIKVAFWLSVLSLLGVAAGWYASRAFHLLLLMGLLILASAVAFLLSLRRGGIDSGGIIVDVEKGEVTFPPWHELAGTYRMEELSILIRSDEERGHAANREWWVVLGGSAGADYEGSYTFESPLYGPGFRPDMMTVAIRLGELGPWREVERL